mmetsp:Transcript_48040/g.116736  ORF Transcript_48040/g.116736 Transcript_48040/m.116736 type:complete len:206 (+) Transcript_48040:1452-2069(+)
MICTIHDIPDCEGEEEDDGEEEEEEEDQCNVATAIPIVASPHDPHATASNLNNALFVLRLLLLLLVLLASSLQIFLYPVSDADDTLLGPRLTELVPIVAAAVGDRVAVDRVVVNRWIHQPQNGKLNAYDRLVANEKYPSCSTSSRNNRSRILYDDANSCLSALSNDAIIISTTITGDDRSNDDKDEDDDDECFCGCCLLFHHQRE